MSSLAVLEIFAGKINALLSRTAPRDLYDVYNIIKAGFFQEKNERDMLRKAVVFYRAISQKEINEELAAYRAQSDLVKEREFNRITQKYNSLLT